MRGNGVPENYGARGAWGMDQSITEVSETSCCESVSDGAGAVLYYRGKFYPIWES